MAETPNVIGRYRVIRRLGSGGMGVVFLAHDPVIDRQVAVKVLRTSLDDDDVRERFLREARSAGRLAHPNIVTIFDTSDYQGQPFIAMAYIDGETLDSVIDNRSTMRLSRKLELMDGLCAGLGYAHNAGVIHRDIKPNNLIIDDNGDVKILDFGVARLAQASQTGVTVVGTPSFMSPEQINGARIDHRSDIFAVGLVLYELVSYRRAFAGEGVFHQVLTEQPQPLTSLCPEIDPALDAVVIRALKKNPDERYQTLAEMRGDLTAILARVRDNPALDVTTHFVPVSVREKAAPKAPRPRGPDLKLLEARRRERIQELLVAARQAFDAERLDDAVDLGDQVLLLDLTNAEALELVHEARSLIDQRQVDGWLNEARTQIGAGALTTAGRLISQALSLIPNQQTARQLQREVLDLRKERDKQRQEAQQIEEQILAQRMAPGDATEVGNSALPRGEMPTRSASQPAPMFNANLLDPPVHETLLLKAESSPNRPQRPGYVVGRPHPAGQLLDVPAPLERRGSSRRILAVAAAAVAVVAVLVGLWRFNRETPATAPQAPPVTERPSPIIAPPPAIDDSTKVADLLRLAASDEAANRQEAALRAFSDALALDKNSSQASSGVARIQALLKRRENVIATLSAAAAARDRGNLAEARKYLATVLELDPANDAAQSLLASITLETVGQEKENRVRRLIRQADALRAAQLLDEAIDKYREALAADPQSAAAREGLRMATEQKILGGGKPPK